MKDDDTRKVIKRPTSYWVEQIDKTKYCHIIREKKEESTIEINNLRIALSISKQRRDMISKKIIEIEPKLLENDGSYTRLRKDKDTVPFLPKM
mmetsp:Transcript_15181/g.19026  ORF Transcript_15181/g.19026 Transcript_15181/m.19026 type:complete len:93 (+) Transcript_15181:151-429(+)